MLNNLEQRLSLLLVIALNLMPIWGVIHWGWTPFYVFYLFWLETLIIAVFNTLKIIGCRGDEFDEKLHNSNHPYKGLHVNYVSHAGKAIRYLLMRIGIFCFYLIFIVTFIGIMASQKSEHFSILSIILFRNPTFNYTLLAIILNQLRQLIFYFYINGDYKRTHPSDFASIFDGRQLIVHIAVVLGGVLASQKKIFNTDIEPGNISLIIVTIFCFAKSVYEIFLFNSQRNTLEKRNGGIL